MKLAALSIPETSYAPSVLIYLPHIDLKSTRGRSHSALAEITWQTLIMIHGFNTHRLTCASPRQQATIPQSLDMDTEIAIGSLIDTPVVT